MLEQSVEEPARMPLRALVWCGWPLTALGVRDAVAGAGITCAAVTDLRELLARLADQEPDLCLLVVPCVEPVPEVVARVHAVGGPTRIVVLAADEAPAAQVLATLKAGADGWLPLDAGGDRLGAALRAVALGEAAVPRTLLSRVLAELRVGRGRSVAGSDGRLQQLSGREADVLSFLADGLSTAQVAVRLGVGPATVRGYVASAVRRLGVADRQAAVALVAGAPPSPPRPPWPTGR